MWHRDGPLRRSCHLLSLWPVIVVSPQQRAGHYGPLGKGGRALGCGHRKEAPDRRVQRETRRHHGPTIPPFFASSAFDVTITHPLQQKYLEIAMEEAGVAAQDAHDKSSRSHL